MPISGLTDINEDSNPVFEMLGVADIKCYKGARKTGTGDSTLPGSDLKSKIRVTTSHRGAIAVLKDCYGEPNGQGDFIVDELRLYLALDDPDLAFETQMKAFDGSGTLIMCDRNTIYKEADTITTHKGKRRVLRSCDKPCPLQGTDEWDCPNECKPDGILHFYIRELLDSDWMIHCQFETKAYGDVSNLIKQIRGIQRELGSLTQSPYPCYWTRHKIPLILSRVERSRKRPATTLKPEAQWKRPGKKEYEYTGKKGDAKFWDLDLQIDPVWMDWYRKRQLAEELIQRGIEPTREVIVGLMTGDVTVDVKAIAASAMKVPALPPVGAVMTDEGTMSAPTSFIPTSPKERLITQQMLVQLEATFEESGWTEEAIAKLLEHYKILDLAEITQEQRLELATIASNSQAARYWNDQALAPKTDVEVVETITEEDWVNIIYPAFVANQWTSNKQAIMSMLHDEYGISRVGQLLKSQIEEVVELARSEKVRSRWMPPQ